MIKILNRTTIKYNAKKNLSNNWLKAISIIIIISSISLLIYLFDIMVFKIFNINPISNIITKQIKNIFNFPIIFETIIKNILPLFLSLITLLINVVIISPLFIGAIKWFYLNMNNDNVPIIRIFDFFSSPKIYFKSIFLQLNIIFKSIFYTLLFNIPFLISILTLEFVSSYNNVLSKNILLIVYFISIILFVICNLLNILFLFRYFLVYFIFIIDNNINLSDIIKISINKMKDYKLEILSLFFSFFLLFILSLFIIPIFFIIPYIISVSCIYAKSIIK